MLQIRRIDDRFVDLCDLGVSQKHTDIQRRTATVFYSRSFRIIATALFEN